MNELDSCDVYINNRNIRFNIFSIFIVNWSSSNNRVEYNFARMRVNNTNVPAFSCNSQPDLPGFRSLVNEHVR
jgi:hypothetical protein